MQTNWRDFNSQNSYTVPLIRKGTNYVAIGTQGGHGGEVSMSSVQDVVESMEGVKALRAEVVSKDPQILNTGYHPMSIEMLSIASVVPDNWQPLATANRDGQLLSDIVKEYGIPTELYEMFLFSRYFKDSIQLFNFLSDPVRCINEHRESLNEVLRLGDGLNLHADEMDVERVMSNLYDNSKLLLLDLGEEGLPQQLWWYILKVNEFELWKPDIEQMRQDYPDEKIAVVGGGRHIDFFVDVLEGNHIPQPSIDDLRLALTDDRREALDILLRNFGKS